MVNSFSFEGVTYRCSFPRSQGLFPKAPGALLCSITVVYNHSTVSLEIDSRDVQLRMNSSMLSSVGPLDRDLAAWLVSPRVKVVIIKFVISQSKYSRRTYNSVSWKYKRDLFMSRWISRSSDDRACLNISTVYICLGLYTLKLLSQLHHILFRCSISTADRTRETAGPA